MLLAAVLLSRNYYGYALFYYHTLNNFAGQQVHLPNRTLSFAPHHSAFNASGVAVLPVLLGGQLGTLTLTNQTATILMSFLSQPLSFVNVTICQHRFDTSVPHVLRPKDPYTLVLPSPCNTGTAHSAIVRTGRCTLSPPVSGSRWQSADVSAPERTNVTLRACQQLTVDHRKFVVRQLCRPCSIESSHSTTSYVCTFEYLLTLDMVRDR